MRSLFRATASLLFGSGTIQGSVKKVTALKIDYTNWALNESTRAELAQLHHPLVTEYFIRLQEKNRAIEKAQEESTGGDALALTNKTDGSPFNLIKWNATYRDEVETAERMAALLRELDETIQMKDQLVKKKSDGSNLTEEDAQILEVVEEELPVLLSSINELDSSVTAIMERRLGSEDAVGSSSKVWEIVIAGKAGGEEAGLFAGELAEMFKAYATDIRDIKVRPAEETSDASSAAAGAVTSTSGSFKYTLQGEGVYRYFHHEIGVHKVQRVPVTDAAGKMQTSTAVVTMMPILDPVSVDVHESDCNIDFVRGSGPGGQGMQSSSNCVVLTHRPSGISVKCHQSRSALGNKELALQMVAQQILGRRVREQNSALHDAWRNQWTSGERSEKMRTYNYPQNRVTDHRIGKDYPLTNFMDRGKGLKDLHDELNAVNDRDQLNTVLLKHIVGEFGSTV